MPPNCSFAPQKGLRNMCSQNKGHFICPCFKTASLTSCHKYPQYTTPSPTFLWCCSFVPSSIYPLPSPLLLITCLTSPASLRPSRTPHWVSSKLPVWGLDFWITTCIFNPNDRLDTGQTISRKCLYIFHLGKKNITPSFDLYFHNRHCPSLQEEVQMNSAVCKRGAGSVSNSWSKTS